MKNLNLIIHTKIENTHSIAYEPIFKIYIDEIYIKNNIMERYLRSFNNLVLRSWEWEKIINYKNFNN